VTADDALLTRAGHGDAGARQACVERFGPLVWALARRHTPSRADAEDAAQEIFVDLLRSADRFDPARSSENGFVAMIARRRLIDLARRRAVRAVEPADDVEPSTSSARLDERVDASKAARTLAALPERERSVLSMITYEGLSQQEIADKTGMPLGTVKTFARRALLRARELMSDGPRARDVATEVES
jgi:RNA polymerase sigma-70 factor, ECF subfamily